VVKSPIGAGEVLVAVDILADFQALRDRANFLLDELFLLVAARPQFLRNHPVPRHGETSGASFADG
jgi:hypothetical protein